MNDVTADTTPEKKSEKNPENIPEQNHQNRRKILTLLTCLFILIGIIWLIYWLIWGQFEEYTDDAYVNGDIVQLMSQVNGTVTKINTDEPQLVLQGQPLVELDNSNVNVALQKSQAELANTVRQVRQYFENAKQTQATLTLRTADLVKAKLDFQRRKGLVGEQAVSREELQHYATAFAAAQAQYDFALHSQQAAFALVEHTQVYSHPLVENAKQNLRFAFLNKQRITILSPVTGYVAKRSVQLGQEVALNTALLAVIPLNQVWVDANYKESQINNLRIGQPVTLYADAYPDVTYHGKLLGLSPGTGVSFSLLPPQNATGNWIKIVQRLPVRIGLDVNELKRHPLLIGLSMRVTTDTSIRTGHRLAKTNTIKTKLSTDVYQRQLDHANALIEKILHANSPNLVFDGKEKYAAK